MPSDVHDSTRAHFAACLLTIMVGIVAMPAALALVVCAMALRLVRRIGVGDEE